MAQLNIAAKPAKIADYRPSKGTRTANAAEDAELAQLIVRVADGSQEAFARFYDLTKGVAFGLINRILGDHNLAEEVLMDVYMQVWHQSSSFDPERGSAFSWLVMMARCRAIDRIRSARYLRHEREPLESAFNIPVKTENPEQASLFSERRIQIRTALATLSREQREVIEIAYFGGYTQTEIAVRLSLPLGTVKTRMRCGLMKLKESMTSM